MAERPSQDFGAAMSFDQAAPEPAPMPTSLTYQEPPAATPPRQAPPAPMQLAANASEDAADQLDDAPVVAPAKADESDAPGVDGPNPPETENPPS